MRENSEALRADWCQAKPLSRRRSPRLRLICPLFCFAFCLLGQTPDTGADEPRPEQAASCLTILPNLDGWYDFDGLSNPTPGVGGLGPEAVWFGSPVTVPGLAGAALSFNGSSYLEVLNSSAFNYPTQSFSISLWVRTTTTGRPFIDKRCVGTAGGCQTPQGWALTVSPAGHLQLLMGSAVPYFYEGFAAYNLKRINDGEWHFVAVTVDRQAQRLTFVVDPYSDGGVQVVSIEGYAGAIPSLRPMRIGGDQTSAAKFVGDLDEIQIYGRALAVNEVQAVAGVGPGGQCRPPVCSLVSSKRTMVGWYSFEETAGVVWQDRAGQNNYLAGVTEQVPGLAGFGAQFARVNAGEGLKTADGATELDLGTNNLAVASWIRFFPANGTRRAIADKTGDQGGGYTLSLEDGYLRFSMTPTGQPRASSSWWVGNQTRLDDGRWHHVAVVADRTAMAPELYVDGRPERIGNSRGTMVTVSISSRSPLNVGGFSSEASETVGTIDELAIFNAGLTAAEVQSMFDAGGSGYCRRNDQGCIAPPTGLVSWYRFENPAGGFDDAGIVPNEPMVVAGTISRTVGRTGRGVRVQEGASSLRTLGATSKLNFDGGTFSIGFWIQPSAARGFDAVPGVAGTRTILEKMSYTSPPNAVRAMRGYRLRLVNGRIEMALASGGNLGIWTGSAALRSDQWSHITVVIPRDGAPVVYLNGKSEMLAAAGVVPVGSLGTTTPVLVGLSADVTQNPADGVQFDFDELAFYGRALTVAEIQALALTTVGQCFEGLSAPVKAVFEVNTLPEAIGATVGVSGDSSGLNGYATTIAPAAVTVSPATLNKAGGVEYRFRNWSLNGVPNPEWTSLVQSVPLPTTASSYTANYDSYFQLQVNVLGNCQVLPPAGYYLDGSTRTLVITLAKGWILESALFTLNGLSKPVQAGAQLTITGPAALDVICRDATVFPITVNTYPANVGLNVTADGNLVSNSQTFNWPTIPARLLNVPQQIQVVGLTQYTFRRWRNTTTNVILTSAPLSSVVVLPTAATSFTADFDPTGYQILVRQPSGCVISVSPSPGFTGFYPLGTSLTVSVTASSGYAPGLLSIQPVGASLPITRSSPTQVNVDSPMTISAECYPQTTTVRFVSSALTQAKLGISFASAFNTSPVSAQGTSPVLLQVGPGLMTLSAEPTTAGTDGSIRRFVDITPGNLLNNTTIPTPSVSTTYTANYDVQCYNVNISTLPANAASYAITLLGGEKPFLSSECYAPGSQLSIEAFPKPGRTFVGWTGDATGSATTIQVTVTRSLNIGAQLQ